MGSLRLTDLVRLAFVAISLTGVSVSVGASTYHLPLLPSAADSSRQGIVRIVNHSASVGEVEITAIDDSGLYYGPTVLAIEARAAVQFSSEDLERGNETRGIAPGVGGGHGNWRLVLESDLDIEPLAYAQTPAGFIDSLHDVVPQRSFYRRVALSAPDGAHGDDGTLRLINTGFTVAEVVVFGLDSNGGPALWPVVVSLPAQASRSITATDLQYGAPDLTGSFGDAEGDWRLLIFADGDIEVMTVLDNPSDPLANLSTADFGHRKEILLFPSYEESSRQGVLRIASKTGAGTVAIDATDESGQDFGPVTLSLDGEREVVLDSSDLEFGNPAKGLPEGLGRGEGDWRLSFSSRLDLDVFAYAHTSDGMLTAIGDVTVTSDQRHHVPLFFAASETRRTSQLRLINPGIEPASIRIQAWDDAGEAASDGAVRLSVPAGATRIVDAGTLEEGSSDLDGNLGRGKGNWRLLVHADRDIHVMSLATSADGYLTNISSSSIAPEFLAECVGGSPDGDDDGIADHCDEEPYTALRPLSACADGTYVALPGDYEGLVGDCRVLIGFANYQAQSKDVPGDHAVRRWGFDSQRRIDDWSGISVSLFGLRVTRIDLEGSEEQPGTLTGFIPPQLAQLTELQVLDLSRNRLIGSIPPDLGRLDDLYWLNLGGNQLSGKIPPELGQLVNLTGLFLYRNDLSGPIPKSLGALVDLKTLSLGGNRLSGAIPTEIGQLTELVNLWLWGNELSGSIPPELGDLANLMELQLGDNNLRGAIPSALGELAELEELNLRGNRLTGSIPPELGQLTRLTELWLYSNDLTGVIPPQLGRLTHLQKMSLYDNNLTGPIPSELGQLSQLTGLWLYRNDLTGEIPSELGHLTQLNDLSLSRNRLTGSIPSELGQLIQLTELWLYGNDLIGSVPVELQELSKLEILSISNNRLTGTIPWALWDRSQRGELALWYSGNAIEGVSPPLPNNRPVFSGSSTANGNATHHSVSIYQGPLTWEWDWEGGPVQHQQPLLGRWALLAVRIEHEISTPPMVATRVLDSSGSVLAERLSEAAPPMTESVAAGTWRTEYVFDLPGALYQTGNQVIHIIDPDNDLAETNEDDNVGAPIRLHGRRPPHFRVTFVPLYAPGEEPPSLDPASLMSGTRAYLPVRDDYHAVIGWPRQSDAADKHELLDEIRALWNADADADEFYHGIYQSPWPGTGNWDDRRGGVASRPGWVGVSALSPHSTIPHEIGHNLNLRHSPGCGAGEVDQHYPYANGALGTTLGWDVNWRRFASGDHEAITDVMSYCGSEHLISDYNYRKATEYWLGTASVARSLIAQPPPSRINPRGPDFSNRNQPSQVFAQQTPDAQGAGGLALSGRIDATGAWSLTHVQRTEKAPRPPSDGGYTLILLDGDGSELYREPLAPSNLSEGDEGGWAARTPQPERPAREVIILDPLGGEVLHEALPLVE